MTISSTLTWESEIAKGASKDAAALRRLTKALLTTGAAVSAASTGALSASLGAVGNASAIAAVQVEQLRGANQREAAAAASAAQQNAALAKIVVIQAKASADASKAKAKAAADETKALEKEEAKRIAIAERAAKAAEKLAEKRAKAEAKAAADARKIAEKEATDRARRSAAPGGADAEGALGSLMGGGGKLSSAIELVSSLTPKLAYLGSAAGPIGAAATMAIHAASAVAEAVYSAYQQAAAILTSLTQTGIGLVFAATSSREAMVGTFEALGKTQGQSEALYEKIVAMSIRTGRDKTLIANEFKRLAAVGFKDEQLPAITQMLAEVSAVKGEGKANQLEKLFTKIQAKDALDPRVVTALTNQGFSQKELYATLAKALKKSEADIPGLIKAGKINAATAEDAIAKVVAKQLGPAAEKQANTVLALLARIKIAAEELFAVGDTQIAPVKKFLQGILAMLSSGYGDNMKAAIGKLFGSIFGVAFDELNSQGGQDKMVHMFAKITEGVNKTAEAVEQLRPIVSRLIAELDRMSKNGTIDRLVKVAEMTAKAKIVGVKDDIAQAEWKAKAATSPGEAAKDFVTNPFKEIARGTGHGGAYEEGERGLRKKLGIEWDEDDPDKKKKPAGPANTNATNGFALPKFATDDATADMSEQGSDIGSALNLGMVLGIQENQDAAIAAAGLTAEMIIARVRAVLRTHSPSEEFGDIAGDSVAGMTQGFTKHGPKAVDAAGKMAQNALASARLPQRTANSTGAGTPGAGGTYNVTVNVAAGANGPDIAAAVMAELRRMSEAA